jgi:hypothetical protein
MTRSDEYDRLYCLVAGLGEDDGTESLADPGVDLNNSLDLMDAFNLLTDLHCPTRWVPVDDLNRATKHAEATALIDVLLATANGLPERLRLLELADLLASSTPCRTARAGDRP